MSELIDIATPNLGKDLHRLQRPILLVLISDEFENHIFYPKYHDVTMETTLYPQSSMSHTIAEIVDTDRMMRTANVKLPDRQLSDSLLYLDSV